MSLQTDIKPYIFNKSVVGLYPNALGYDDNAHFFSAVYLKLSKKRFEMNLEQYDIAFDGVYDEFKLKCEIFPGLYRRSPSNEGRIISHDEMIGICSTDRVAAANIVTYGEAHDWCFDNRNLDMQIRPYFVEVIATIGLLFYDWKIAALFAPLLAFLIECSVKPMIQGWQGRFLSPIGYYRARGSKMTFLDKLKASIDLLWVAYRNPVGEVSNRQLLYMMSDEFAVQGSKMLSFAVSKFKESCTDNYGDLQGMFSIYYPKDHPLVTYSKGVPF